MMVAMVHDLVPIDLALSRPKARECCRGECDEVLAAGVHTTSEVADEVQTAGGCTAADMVDEMSAADGRAAVRQFDDVIAVVNEVVEKVIDDPADEGLNERHL